MVSTSPSPGGPVLRDPYADARAFVGETYPRARWAVLTGSVLDPRRRTSGSDLDIVVLLPDGDPEAPFRDSRRYRDWPVETFLHDEESLAHYLAKELPLRRPTLHRMVATGTALAGDLRHLTEVRGECARVLAGGPEPPAEAERDAIRYRLTDLLDDLVHATNPGERTVIAATAWAWVAADALTLGRHWTGTGKWLLRELRDFDPELAERWWAPARTPTRSPYSSGTCWPTRADGCSPGTGSPGNVPPGLRGNVPPGLSRPPDRRGGPRAGASVYSSTPRARAPGRGRRWRPGRGTGRRAW